MSDVKQTIQVTNAGLSPILSIAQGTGMVEFEFTVSDFQIPAGSTAVAHNIQPTGNIVSQVCTLVGNVITVTPPAYYFLRGKNYMQIQVTGADGVNLFTFLIEVWCSPNISAPVVSQNPDLITQLMAMIGNMQDLDTTAKNNLVAAINEIYARGVVDILDTEEEIEANTDAGKATGALVAKQLISEISELSGKLKNTIQLYSGTSFNGNIELSQPYNDFLLICIVVFYGTGGCIQQLIPPNILEITNEKNRNILFMGHQNNSISMRFTDYNTCVVQLIEGTNNPYVAGIYGLR